MLVEHDGSRWQGFIVIPQGREGRGEIAFELQKVSALFGVSFGTRCKGGISAFFQPTFGSGNKAARLGLLVAMHY